MHHEGLAGHLIGVDMSAIDPLSTNTSDQSSDHATKQGS